MTTETQTNAMLAEIETQRNWLGARCAGLAAALAVEQARVKDLEAEVARLTPAPEPAETP